MHTSNPVATAIAALRRDCNICGCPMDVGSKPVRGWLIKKGRHAMGAALHGTSAGYNFASTPRVSAYRNGC